MACKHSIRARAKASLCYILTPCSSEFVEFLNRLFNPPSSHIMTFQQVEVWDVRGPVVCKPRKDDQDMILIEYVHISSPVEKSMLQELKNWLLLSSQHHPRRCNLIKPSIAFSSISYY